MKYLKISFLMILFISSPIYELVGEESIEYQLACINAGRRISNNDLTIAKFRDILMKLTSSYSENKQQIGDMSVKAQQMLLEKGIKENLYKIMDGMYKIVIGKNTKFKYAENIGAYITLRTNGYTHLDAVEGVKSVLDSMGIK